MVTPTATTPAPPSTPTSTRPSRSRAGRRLAIYLRDHHAGSAAGLALVRHCRRANAGTALDELLAAVEAEIVADRRALLAIMATFGVRPSRVKSGLAVLAEGLRRLKRNGRLVRYSPSSRIVELELLAAGIDTKRNLWRALDTIASAHPQLDRAELGRLIDRAGDQHERVLDQHGRAAVSAF